MSRCNVLMACYGGGHAQIIASVYHAMQVRGIEAKVIGFTTAYRSLRRAGVPACSVIALIDYEADASYLDAAAPFLGNEIHPDVTLEETKAYYALGLRDLVERMGWNLAIDAVREHGRKAFEPVSIMARYLQREQPDIVVTTTSPRFELALLKAARALRIPTLAIGDLFLVQERSWILGENYAEHLAVLSEGVADALVEEGFERSSIRVTGNPAFDSLALKTTDAARRAQLRKEWGLSGKTVVLWPAAGSANSMTGQPFLSVGAVVPAFEGLCQKDPSFSYIYRMHPNHPEKQPESLLRGRLDDGKLSPEDALLVSDVVCVEVSTMGLQAALRGIPVICVGFADYTRYAQFGFADSVDTLDAAVAKVLTRNYTPPSPAVMPPLGTATSQVLAFIDDILTRRAGN